MRLSLTTAIVGIVILVHALALPPLYLMLSGVVRASYQRSFVNHARTFAKMLAEQLEIEGPATSPQRIREVLDLAILNGSGIYAEYVDGRDRVRSVLGRAGVRVPAKQDFQFGEQGDHAYFLKVPIESHARSGELRVGFDETPTERSIERALHRMRLVLIVYAVVSLVAAALLGLRMSRPIRGLGRTARAVASGDYGQRLRVASGIGELRDLAADLDRMRGSLVGASERLRIEMAERERAEMRRRELESDLRHRQRLETVGTLAGGIAHEFNNALQPVILFTEAALEDLPPNSPVRDDLSRVLASARRARDVVAKILTFSHKFDAAQLAPVDLRQAVEDAVKLFTALVPSSVAVSLEIADEKVPVRADAALVQQLIMNLCVNGYQALGERDGRITIGLRRVPTHGGTVGAGAAAAELWVRDNGHGMDQGTAARIFEPFFTTRGVGQGTGLGLSVVHGIAESFGARIAVDTAPGVGTTFRVLFPVAEEAA